MSISFDPFSGRLVKGSRAKDVDVTNVTDLTPYATKEYVAQEVTGIDYSTIVNTPNFHAVATSGNYGDLLSRPSLSSVATTGDYNDLTNVPDLTNVATRRYVDDEIAYIVNSSPENLNTLSELSAALNNDENFAANVVNTLALKADTTYVDAQIDELIGSAPGTLDTLKELATAIGDDPSFSTNLTATLDQKVDASNLSTVATTGSYSDLIGAPDLTTYATKTYVDTAVDDVSVDLTGYATTTYVDNNVFSGNYNDLANKPTFSSVALTGDYNDLTNTPTIPTVPDFPTTEFANIIPYTDGNGGLTSSNALNYNPGLNILNVGSINLGSGDISSGTDVITFSSNTSGIDYNDLNNTPDLTTYATTTYVDSAVSNLVDTAPETLDTLNELSAALGDDPNFATTVSNELGLKANSADLATVATTGSYNDLSDKPTFSSVDAPATASLIPFADGNDNFASDSTFNYNDTQNVLNVNSITITGSIESSTSTINIGTSGTADITLGNSTGNVSFQGSTSGIDYADVVNTPNLATVATSGSYNDLTDTPSVPSIPTTVDRIPITDGSGNLIVDSSIRYTDNGTNTLVNFDRIDMNRIIGDYYIRTNNKSVDVLVETNTLDDESGNSSGITLRAMQNPINFSGPSDPNNFTEVGAIFSVRSSGDANRLWVGQGITSTGANDFTVGGDRDEPWKSHKALILASNGEARFDGEVYAFYSDERLKNFEGNINNALEKVTSLNGYYFTENDTAKELGYDNDQRQVGVSAQEVEKVLPEVVAPAPVDPEYKTVKYEKMVPLLIEAIKDLKQDNDDLRQELAELKGLIGD